MEEKKPEGDFYRNFCSVVEGTERTISNSTHKYVPLLDDAANFVEATLYSNLIRLFEHNLNQGFFDKVKMAKRDRDELMEMLGPFFDRAKATSESSYNQGEVDFFTYQEFRTLVHDFGDDTYWLLLGVERYADLIACEHRLITFRKHMTELKLRYAPEIPRKRR